MLFIIFFKKLPAVVFFNCKCSFICFVLYFAFEFNFIPLTFLFSKVVSNALENYHSETRLLQPLSKVAYLSLKMPIISPVTYFRGALIPLSQTSSFLRETVPSEE